MIKITDRDSLMNVLRYDLHQVDLVMLATRIGVHVSPLRMIRSGKTKWPRHSTLLTLIQVLGYELWLTKQREG